MGQRFNVPPNWPTPSPGWTPQPGWQPDPAWGAAPAGWQLWVDDVQDAPGATAVDEPARRIGLNRRTLTAGGVGLLVILMLATGRSGFASVLVFAGLAALVVGGIGVFGRRVRWAKVTSRSSGAIAAGVGLAVLIVGGALEPPSAPASVNASAVDTAQASQTTSTTSTTPSSSTTTSPTSSATTSSTTTTTTTTATPSATPLSVVDEAIHQASSGTALAALAGVRVAGRAAKTGYARTLFGQAWTDVDRNGCDTRNDVLRRDLTQYVLKAGTHGCLVLKGTLRVPYTGRSTSFVRGSATSSAVQIDHVVALSDAWQKGAQPWPAAKRAAFANDSLNLLAVDGPTNESKGDGDAATWLPPVKSYRCAYVARQEAVKLKYGLWMTAAERDATARVLRGCASQRLPAATPFRLGGGTIASPPLATVSKPPTSTHSSSPTPGSSVFYANCSAVRAAGAAPIHPGDLGWQPKFDRDGDGIGCE